MHLKKNREMESKTISRLQLLGEIITAGAVAAIKIRRNTLGEKTVEKGEDIEMTIERFRVLQTLQTEELRGLPTHEKVIWLRWMIDSNTPAVT